MTSHDHLVPQLEEQLRRLDVVDAEVSLDDQYEPAAGTLVRLQLSSADWHFLPGTLLQLLRKLPDHAGSEAIKEAIGKGDAMVWQGPSPEGSRDRHTSF